MKAITYFYKSFILSCLFTLTVLFGNPLYAQFGDNLGKHKADRALDMNAKDLQNVALLKYKTLAVTDKATGDIGTAATTVDLYTAFEVNQATPGQTLTLHAPTAPFVGQTAYVKNIGSVSFTMYGTTVAANAIVQLAWDGTSWAVSATGQSVNALGAPSGTNANGGGIAGNTLTLSLADGTNPGLLSAAAQTIAGAKTFSAAPTVTPFSTAGVVHNNASGVLASSAIVNADVDAAAAIAGSKISPDFGAQDVATTGTITANRYLSALPSVITAAPTTTIDLAAGSVFAINVGASISTLALSNASTLPRTFVVKLSYASATAYTIAWPSNFKWALGAAPALTCTAGKVDIVSVIFDGTDYYCTYALGF